MIEIIGLAEHDYESMKSDFGERIFEAQWAAPYNIELDKEREHHVILNKNAQIKFFGFDSSICIDLGAKKYIIENNDYYKVELS